MSLWRSLCLFGVIATFSAYHAKAQVTIMPMGDSLTAGVDYYTVTASGYRDPLCHDLTPYLNFTFVGAVNNTGTNTRYLNSKSQQMNNGYGGYEIIDLYNNLDGNVAPVAGGDGNQGGYWITGGGGTGRGPNLPNVLLLQIGANDFIQGSSASTAETNLHNLVTKFHTLSPNTTILVAGIPPFALDTSLNSTVQAYDTYIQNTLVPSFTYTRYVDNYTIFFSGGAVNTLDFGTDNGLGVHPNRYGYPIMAASWARAIFSLEGLSPTTYALTVGNGTANNIAGGSSYPAGTIVTVNSNPPSGNQFSYWSPSNMQLDNPYWPIATYTMPAAAASVTANYATSGSPSIPNGTYQIVGGPDDFQFTYSISPTGLSIGAASAAAGQPVQVQTYSGASTQQWVVNNLGNNVVELSLPGTSLALSVVGASTTAGAYLDVETYTNASSQQWTLMQILGTTEIVNVNSGMAINITGYNGTPGQQLDQYNAGYVANQLWAFFLVSGGGGSAPSAPTGLTATPGNALVNLSWTASSGATSYNIYRGTSSGNETTTVATGVTSTSYTNTGLTNGTMYYYRITATNSYGTSGYSNEASATPTAGVSIPPAPTNLTASPGNAQAVLSWTASSGATSYNVYRGTSSGSETSFATGITTTTYTNTGLTNGTTYYYKVAAVNSAGTSGLSNEASATPAAGGSSNSIGFQFQGSGTALAASDQAGLSTVAQINWNVLTGSSFSSVALKDSSATATTATLSGSANGTYFASTSSAPPAVGNNKLASGELYDTWPSPPTLTVSGIPYAKYDVYIYAAIDAPGRNETSALTPSGGSTQYYSFTTEGGGSAWTAATSTYNGSGTAPTLPAANLVHYTALTASSFTLAIGAPGNGGINGIQIVPVSGGGSAPNPPTGLTATPGNAQVSLSWTASSGATSYNIYRGTSSGNETTTVVTGVTGTSYTNTGLTNGTMYYYRITATNSYGTSGYSNEASATPTSGGGGGAQLIGLQYQTNGSALIGSLTAGVTAQSSWNVSSLPYVVNGTYTASNLVTSTGAASTISESTVCYGGYDHPNGSGFASGTGNYALFGGYALGSYSGVPSVTVTLSGLSASANYTLVTYVGSSSTTDVISGSVNVSGATTYYIKGGVSNTLTQGTATSSAAAAAGNYFKFTNITGVTSVTFTLTDTGSGTAGLYGFQLSHP